MLKFGKRSIENLCGVDPKLVMLLQKSIETSLIDFGVDYGVRSAETQHKLWRWGREIVNPNTGPIKGNKFGMIVTSKDGYIKKSKHQEGKAVDIYPYYNGSLQTNDVKTLLKLIAHIKNIAKEMGGGFIFGADWKKPYDPPHIEI